MALRKSHRSTPVTAPRHLAHTLGTAGVGGLAVLAVFPGLLHYSLRSLPEAFIVKRIKDLRTALLSSDTKDRTEMSNVKTYTVIDYVDLPALQ